jgi:hypothetical protein
MTPFSRLVMRLSKQRKPLLKDVELLVAYHTQALTCIKTHSTSDQHYIASYYLQVLNSQLHGTVYDYSALVIQPAEEVARLERLLKKYRKVFEKKGWKLTFWHFRKTGHKTLEGFSEMEKFQRWYTKRRARVHRH